MCIPPDAADRDSRLSLQIWDLAGNERFKTITSNYYRGAHEVECAPTSLTELSGANVGLFVFDGRSTEAEVSSNLDSWIKDSAVSLQVKPLIVVRTKIDVATAPSSSSTNVSLAQRIVDLATTTPATTKFVLNYMTTKAVRDTLYIALPLTQVLFTQPLLASNMRYMEVSSATGAGVSELVANLITAASTPFCARPRVLVTEADIRERAPLIDAPWYKRVAYFY